MQKRSNMVGEKEYRHVVRVDLTEKGTFKQRLQEVQKLTVPVLEAGIQGCGETSAKALRWKHNGVFEEQKGGSVTGGAAGWESAWG